MREEIDRPEQTLARIAARQHGVVTIGQLHSAGVEKSRVSRELRVGRLHRVHRGVYTVGHPGLGLEARWMAAVLASGPGSALSHRSAAVRWGMLPSAAGPIDVSAPTYAGRVPAAGVRLHRCRSLTPDLVIRRNRVPVTIPARTIADLRKAVPAWEFRRAVRQAEIGKLSLGPGLETDRTRSDLERDFLRLCKRHELPLPEVNVRVGRWTVDFLWRRERVVVETGTYGFHRGTVAFEDDHARDLDLRRHGLDIRRYTRLQVQNQAAEVAADLRDALGLAS